MYKRQAFLSGGDRSEEELREVLRHAYSHGLELAITTIGMRGAIVYDGENFYTKKPFQINKMCIRDSRELIRLPSLGGRDELTQGRPMRGARRKERGAALPRPTVGEERCWRRLM